MTEHDTQINFNSHFERLLRKLCNGIEEPPRTPGSGRKPIPMKDQVFVAVMKVHSGKSQRRVQSDLRDSVRNGNLFRVPNFNIISDFLDSRISTPILITIVEDATKLLTDHQSPINPIEFSPSSKNPIAQENELLCKRICHIITQIIQTTVDNPVVDTRRTEEMKTSANGTIKLNTDGSMEFSDLNDALRAQAVLCGKTTDHSECQRQINNLKSSIDAMMERESKFANERKELRKRINEIGIERDAYKRKVAELQKRIA